MLLVVALAALTGALGLGAFLLGARVPAAPDGAVTIEAAPAAPSAVAELRRRIADATRTRMTSIGRRLASASYPARAQRRLDLAGNPAGWSVPRLLMFRALGLVGGLALGLAAGAPRGPGVMLLFGAGLGAFAFLLPDLLLRRRGESRQLQLQRGLPNAMDMLTVCVEAGMGFDAAVSRVARTLDGAVADEFGRLLQEMQIGRSRTSALRGLVERTDVEELRAFVAAMVQATGLGISIGDVLREQARRMRVTRRQRAEEKAQKMQVKLLMPLVFCLLPAMFVVVLGPAVIHLADFFGSATK